MAFLSGAQTPFPLSCLRLSDKSVKATKPSRLACRECRCAGWEGTSRIQSLPQSDRFLCRSPYRIGRLALVRWGNGCFAHSHIFYRPAVLKLSLVFSVIKIFLPPNLISIIYPPKKTKKSLPDLTIPIPVLVGSKHDSRLRFVHCSRWRPSIILNYE